jgi:rod shape-determining protein MreC
VAAQVVGESPSNFQNTVEINVGSSRGVAQGMPVTDGAGLIGRITKVFPTRSIVLLLTDPEFSIQAQVLTAADDTPSTTTPTGSTTLSGIPISDLTSSTTSSTTTTVRAQLPEGLEPLPTSTTIATTDSGATGSSTPSNSTTTSTSVLEVIRETGLLEGQGAERPMLLRFVDTNSSNSSVKVGAIVDTAGGNNGLAPQGIPIGVITKISNDSGSSAARVEVTPNASLKRLNFVAVVLYVPNVDAVGK